MHIPTLGLACQWEVRYILFCAGHREVGVIQKTKCRNKNHTRNTHTAYHTHQNTHTHNGVPSHKMHAHKGTDK